MRGWRVLLFLLYISLCTAQDYYVDRASNLTTNCGSSWADACGSLESGVEVACGNSTDNPTLWVGPGTYSITPILVPCNLQIRSTNGSAHTILEQFKVGTNNLITFEGYNSGFPAFVGFTFSLNLEATILFFTVRNESHVLVDDIQFQGANQSGLPTEAIVVYGGASLTVSNVVCNQSILYGVVAMYGVPQVNITTMVIQSSTVNRVASAYNVDHFTFRGLDTDTVWTLDYLLNVTHNVKYVWLDNWDIYETGPPKAPNSAHAINCYICTAADDVTMTNSVFSISHGLIYSFRSFLYQSRTGPLSVYNVSFGHMLGENLFRVGGNVLLESTTFSFLQATNAVLYTRGIQTILRNVTVDYATFRIFCAYTVAIQDLFFQTDDSMVSNSGMDTFVALYPYSSSNNANVTVTNTQFQHISAYIETSDYSITVLWAMGSTSTYPTTLTLQSVNFTDIKVGIVDDAKYLKIANCLFDQLNTRDRYAIRMTTRGESLLFDNSVIQNGDAYGFLSIEGTQLTTIRSTSFNNNTMSVSGIVSRNSQMVMEDVTIFGNLAASVSGSFIMLAEGATLSMSDCHIEGNVGYLGGVITVASATVNIFDSLILLNNGTYGGSLYVSHYGNLNISRCNFQNNNAEIAGGSLWLGGDSICVMSDCNITNSRAATEGGGLEVSGHSKFTATNLIISSSSSLTGGGLCFSEYSVSTLRGVNITGCVSSTDGGGFAVTGYASAEFTELNVMNCSVKGVGAGGIATDYSTMKMTDSHIWYNQSPTEGGGIYLDEGSISEFRNVFFVRNAAMANGGAVIMSVSTQAQFYQCHFYFNLVVSKGGAIAMTNNANAILIDSFLQYGSANAGGAIYLDDNTRLVMNNTEIHNNHASSRGGAIYCASASFAEIYHSLLRENDAKNGVGGAAAVQDFATLKCTDTKISENSANYGGGVHSVSSQGMWVHSSTVQANHAVNAGGGFYLAEQANAEFHDLSCLGNRAENGGCLAANDEAAIGMMSVFMNNNTAKLSGGAVLLTQQAFLRMENSTVMHNHASKDGGGYWIASTAFMHDTNTVITNNNAKRHGGGIYLQAGESYFENLFIHSNSAESGGGVAVGIGIISQFATFNSCFIVENNATSQGGGVHLASAEEESTEELGLVATSSQASRTVPRTLMEETDYDFINATIIGNIASVGGGIYIESLKKNITTFGPVANLTANVAYKYGGAIYFGTYLPISFMHNATFLADVAIYGGSNAAYGAIENCSRAGDFCEDCTYKDVTTNVTGYESSCGFASAPSKIAFDEGTGCPATHTLDGKPFSIQVYLMDQFGNQVTGRYLEDNPYVVTMTYSQPEGGEMSTTNNTQEISSHTGAASFTDIEFCGDNNSTYKLQFTARSSSLSTLRSFQTSCSIYLFGCSTTDQEVTSSGSCDTCVSKSTPDDNRPLGVIGILLLVIFVLAVALCVIVGTILGIYYRRKRRRDQLNALEIPDFSERPSLTLADVLNDSSINQLRWEDVKIGMVIGKGASGLVSQGVWTRTEGHSQDVALKELIIGFDELSEEAINEFLVEIKYMSALVNDNIVQFLGILLSPDESKLYLVTELMHKGSVRDILTKKNKNIPPSLRLKIAKDAAKGVAYLHSKKLIHRDLKTHNLLVNAGWNTKVSDFGISTVRPTITRAMTCVGTPVYMAPEVLSKNKYSEKADVFSFGVVLMEIFTNRIPYSRPPYDTMNQAMLMYHIIEKEARPCIEDVHPLLQHLIAECWSTDPRLRPTFSEIVVRLRRLNSQLVDTPSASDSTSDYRRDDTGSSAREDTKPFDSVNNTEEDPLILPDA